jgi:hypothetical protein
MPDSVIPTDDLAAAKENIDRLRLEIEDRMAKYHGKVERIRDDAKRRELEEGYRAHAEVEPLRRQMEVLILAVARYESLKAPAPVIIPVES